MSAPQRRHHCPVLKARYCSGPHTLTTTTTHVEGSKIAELRNRSHREQKWASPPKPEIGAAAANAGNFNERVQPWNEHVSVIALRWAPHSGNYEAGRLCTSGHPFSNRGLPTRQG